VEGGYAVGLWPLRRSGSPRAVRSREVAAVSTESSQTKLDAAHAERRESANLSALFRAHTSPIFFRRSLQVANLAGEVTSSVHTCEQLPMSAVAASLSGDSSGAPIDPERVSQATEALHAGLGRSRERQRKIVELILADEAGHADRLANCSRQSVQLECPHLAGGCGSEDNFVPVTCDSRLCPVCMNRRMGRAMQKYGLPVESFDYAALLTFTIRNVLDPALGKEEVQEAFGKLRRRVIPASGSVVRSDGEGGTRTVRWVWKQGDDGGEPADFYWKSALCAAGRHDLARHLQKRYVDQGKGIPFSEVIPGGLYGIDIKQQDSERYHVHLHALCEVPYVPQAALASVWEDITGASVVDVRRRGDLLSETVGYVCKPPEFESVEDEVEYLKALKGARLMQPFGSLHGNVSEMPSLLECSECGRAPQFWNYLGLVDEAFDNMTLATPHEGDRPPP
jgi:hypothetical protein